MGSSSCSNGNTAASPHFLGRDERSGVLGSGGVVPSACVSKDPPEDGGGKEFLAQRSELASPTRRQVVIGRTSSLGEEASALPASADILRRV